MTTTLREAPVGRGRAEEVLPKWRIAAGGRSAAGRDRQGIVLFGERWGRRGIDQPEQSLGLPRELGQVGGSDAEQRLQLLRGTATVLEGSGRIGEQPLGELVVDEGARKRAIDAPTQILRGA